MGRLQQACREPSLPAGQGGPEVDGAHQSVLGRAQRQLDERCIARQQGGQPSGQRRLGTALLPSEEDASNARVHRGQQQRQPKALLAYHRAERERGPGPVFA